LLPHALRGRLEAHEFRGIGGGLLILKGSGVLVKLSLTRGVKVA
jgi:hypothetical protein